MKVALTYNLKAPDPSCYALCTEDAYAEWDDPLTIEAVRSALALEHDVVLVEDGDDIENRLKAAQPDIVFNMAEGWGGADREAAIPIILQRCGIPFTGSSPHTLRLCLDKAATKQMLRRHGLPTPDYMVVARAADACPLTTFPLIVKPLHEGSSK